MEYAKITNGGIENIILADAEFISTMPGEWVECTGKEWGIGWEFDGTNAYPSDTEQPQPVEAPTAWLIDVGPFYDRFGAAKMAVLTSTDVGVRAILQETNIRKWIDLKRPDVASSLAYIGSKVPAVDAAMQSAILTTPATPDENLALRKLFF